MKDSTLRIIGGKWRSRKIKFTSAKGLRPTTDLNRETLFNWLMTNIADSNCLDLFAGSGALGFEALSRGAVHVVMVDASFKVIKKLQENAELLAAKNLNIYLAKIPGQLNKIPPQPFDIIFIDPPFNFGLIKATCDQLANSPYIAQDSLIYVECEKTLDIRQAIPSSWQIIKQSKSGLAKYYLLQLNDTCN